MQPIITLATLASLATITAAVPLAHSHHHRALHVARHPKALVGSPLAQRQNIDWDNGTCGGSSGFVCGTGFCCSQWGYCGQGAGYCGGSDNAPASSETSTTQPTATAAATSQGGVSPTNTIAPIQSKDYPGAATTLMTSAASSTPASSSSASSTAAPAQPTSAAAATSATPQPSSNAGTGSSGGSGLGNTYTMYEGNGEASAGWPSMDDWDSFDSMWANNENNIMSSCSQFGVPNNSESETADLKSAIESVGSSSGVDPRFILAVVMQESGGCVRAPTTNYGVTNPGLMQDHDGSGTCNDGGSVQNPCPMSEITQMIVDGTEGTSSGEGLKQCLANAPSTSGSAQYYQAARLYNSGSIAAGGNLDAGIATLCYSTDIANRLTGWYSGAGSCNL